MEFEIGQKFGGKYPPEVAEWCGRNGVRIVRDGASGWRIEAMPTPTVEELSAAKREEIRRALDAADWRSMREHDRHAANPTYQTDQTVFAHKQFLRDFDAQENWWERGVPSYEEFLEQNNLEDDNDNDEQ
ncbi:MAG: hypothetical protein LBT98_03470 [Puniceicoccales bacterium]|jgi:hypothetical protein|nr:hypothetical protein [Puniceicoccales bacterium]